MARQQKRQKQPSPPPAKRRKQATLFDFNVSPSPCINVSSGDSSPVQASRPTSDNLQPIDIAKSITNQSVTNQSISNQSVSHQSVSNKPIDKSVEEAANNKSCLLCEGKLFYVSKPRDYPLFEDVLKSYQSDSSVKASDTVCSLWTVRWFPCPFCNETLPPTKPEGEDDDTDSEDSVKSEDAIKPLERPIGAPDDLPTSSYCPILYPTESVSAWLISKLIKAGYPPDVCFPIAARSNMDLLSAEREAEDVCLGRMEHAQMTLAQNESKEKIADERQYQEDGALAEAQQGDINPLISLDADTASQMLKLRMFVFVFQTPREVLLECEDLDTLLMDTRALIFKWFQFVSRAKHWYGADGAQLCNLRMHTLVVFLDALNDSPHMSTAERARSIDFIHTLFTAELQLVNDHILNFRPEAALAIPPILLWARATAFPCEIDTSFIRDYILDTAVRQPCADETQTELIKTVQHWLNMSFTDSPTPQPLQAPQDEDVTVFIPKHSFDENVQVITLSD